MKQIRIILAGFLAVALTAGGAYAADRKVSRSGSLNGTVSRSFTDSSLESLEVKLPAGAQIPDSTRQLVTEFQKQAQAYVARHNELLKQIKGASAEERERLKDQIRQVKQSFLDQTTIIRADIKERIKEIKNNIKENRPLDNGAGEGGGRPRHGKD